MARIRQILSLRNPATRRTLLTGLAFIAGFIVLGVVGVQAWEYSNSVAFCSNTCHNVHPEEPAAFQDSFHARVKCTECHLGRVGALEGMVLKVGHFRHLPGVISDNYVRPTHSETMRPANESCEKCHWPSSFHGDTVREIIHYLPDEDNTKKRTYVILKTGAGEREQGLGFGIHWHIAQEIEYIATDEHKQDIRWIRATLPDGRTVEYNDLANPMTTEEFTDAEVQVMDCVDCHNRVGHPFPYPEQALDDAISDGYISSDLPFVKKELLAVLTAAYIDQEAALAAADAFAGQYQATYPEAAEARAGDIQQAGEVAKDLFTRLVFEEPGITWQSFPNNAQHKEFAGCFRCHDGKHVSPEGESIRLHCNICHSIPVTVGDSERVPQMPVATVEEPDFHRAANFMADHRFQANESCAECHGQIAFGNDDTSFCANSACHGQAWPAVELDAGFEHPIPLQGQHAQVWCHDCHEGVEKPVFECANCHQPPTQPHFGTTCEDCHTPEGFELATLDNFQHPVPLEGEHATLDCMACHVGQPDAAFECATCHRPPENHVEQACDTCHTPQGWRESAAPLVAESPQIPHTLVGLDQCLLCHDPTGQAVPAPAGHTAYHVTQCTLCHKAAP